MDSKQTRTVHVHIAFRAQIVLCAVRYEHCLAFLQVSGHSSVLDAVRSQNLRQAICRFMFELLCRAGYEGRPDQFVGLRRRLGLLVGFPASSSSPRSCAHGAIFLSVGRQRDRYHAAFFSSLYATTHNRVLLLLVARAVSSFFTSRFREALASWNHRLAL